MPATSRINAVNTPTVHGNAHSSCGSAKSSGSRLAYSAKLAVPITIRNARKKYPTLDWVNECTLEITPERVMNVPKIDKSHDPMIRARFHFFNILLYA